MSMADGRRALLAAALSSLVALPSALAAAPAEEPWAFSEAEMEYLESRGPITFVHNPFSPPLSMGDAVQPKGIVADFRRLMIVRTGVAFELVEASNGTDMIARMLNGSVEVSGTLAYSPERAERVDFTEPYAELATYAWGHPRDAGLREDGFRGARVAAVGGSTQEARARGAFPNASLVLVPTTLAGLDALANGSAVAMVGSVPVIAYETRRSEALHDFGPLGAPIERVELAFSTRKGDAMLHGIIVKALASVSPEDRRAIFIKWTGQDLSPPVAIPATVDLRTLAYMAVGLAGVGLAVGIPAWMTTLRRRVARRTADVAALNAELEQRVAERTAALEAANRELEAFTYSVSHDLRAPLRSVDGFSRSILQDHATALPPEAVEDLRRVRAAAQRMGKLIDELLAFSHIGRVRVPPVDVDVSQRALLILGRLREADPGRDVEVRIQPGLHAQADPGLLDVLLGNLLDNAWKFTRDKPHATIEVGRASTPRGEALFVRDDGAGFDPEFQGKLFRPFERLHKQTEFPGNGIGLALAKRIVTASGGDIWAEGALGRGATFYFTMQKVAT